MASFLFVFFIAAVFVGFGWPLIRRLDGSGHLTLLETGSFSFAVGALFLYFGVFVIGPYRLDNVTMWGLAAVMGTVATFGWQRIPIRQIFTTLASLPTSARLYPWTTCLWISTILVGGSSLIQGMAPPSDYDSLMYHLAVPKFDVERGHISIPWDRAIAQITFPQLGGHISRFALITMNDCVAQMTHGLFGLLAAVVSGLIVRRLGYGLNVALIAALFFLVCRVVIWEMGTAETDVPLAAFSALAMLAYLVFRRIKSTGMIVIFGLVIGSAIASKLLGFAVAIAFAPMIISDLWGKKVPVSMLSIGPLVALIVIAPHLILTFNLTGNFFYPFFGSILTPEAVIPFEGEKNRFGTGRGIIDLILAPWTIFVSPRHYYDGMVFGAPYILALAPLAFIKKNSFLIWRGVISFVFIYFVLWFWTFGQQARLLLPLLPYLCGMSAVGLSVIWDLSSNNKLRRASVIVIVSFLGINQALFVGIYTLLRVPPAIGLVDSATYLEKTPASTSSFYGSCSYIDANLKPGERYLSATTQFHSYYCPQAPVVRNFFPDEALWWLSEKKAPIMKAPEFIRRFEEMKLRYVIVSWATSMRGDRYVVGGFEAIKNIAGKPIRYTTGTRSRFTEYLDPAIKVLEPLFRGSVTAVYDGPSVLAVLRQQQNLKK